MHEPNVHQETGHENTGREIPQNVKGETADVDNHYEFKSDLKQTAQTTAAHDENELGPDVPTALTPEQFTGLQVKNTSHVAGGMPAVMSSMKHAYRRWAWCAVRRRCSR